MEQLTLLPPPVLSARMPPPASLAHKLLTMLRAGERITHAMFYRLTGSWRAAAHKRLLVELGWPVEAYEQAAPSPSCPSRHIAVYFLPKWALDKKREAA